MSVPGNSSTGLSLRSLLAGFSLGRLGVAGVGRQRVPAEGLLAVGVGEHELGALRGQALQPGRLVGQCPRVVDGAVGVEQAEPGEVVEAGGVALHHEGAVSDSPRTMGRGLGTV